MRKALISITILLSTITVLGIATLSCTAPQRETAAMPTPPVPTEEASLTPTPQPERFNGKRAFFYVETQVAFGPRLPGSEAHAQAVDWMISELANAGWQTELQETEMMGHPIRNVIAKRGQGESWIVLGAHYDSRFWADEDPDPANHREPVPGANDGASGVAVLLELARTLPSNLEKEIWLVFFDAEDQGNIPDWDWILGSRAFVDSLEQTPDLAIIVDMIGDADLNIHKEKNSDAGLTRQIWDVAAGLGYAEQFIPDYKYSMLSDHTPFVQRGIPAVLLIDFDDPYWHTIADAPDKVSAYSLQAVGDTLTAWLLDQ